MKYNVHFVSGFTHVVEAAAPYPGSGQLWDVELFEAYSDGKAIAYKSRGKKQINTDNVEMVGPILENS